MSRAMRANLFFWCVASAIVAIAMVVFTVASFRWQTLVLAVAASAVALIIGRLSSILRQY